MTVSAQLGLFIQDIKKSKRQREQQETYQAKKQQEFNDYIQSTQPYIEQLKSYLTEQDVQNYLSEIKLFDAQIDSILACSAPHISKGDVIIRPAFNDTKHEFERKLTEQNVERDMSSFTRSNDVPSTHAAFAVYDSIRRAYSDKVQLYRKYISYAKQHSDVLNKLSKLKQVKADLDTILTIIKTEQNMPLPDSIQSTGVYKSTWIEPINKADVITVNAPYKTINGIRAYNGQCVLHRIKKQRQNATGNNYFDTTYDVTITLTVENGVAKSAKYTGSMTWWGQNDKIRKQYKNPREGAAAMLKAKPVIVQTKPIIKYEDFGYNGDLANDMLKQLKTKGIEYDENDIVTRYLNSEGQTREKVIDDCIKQLKASKQMIHIDYEKLKQ